MVSKTSRSRTGRRRKPHNASTNDYASFDELLASIAAEPRTALVGSDQLKMSRSERLFRVMVDRALQGNVREVRRLLHLMATRPTLAATFREETVTVVSGPLCNA